MNAAVTLFLIIFFPFSALWFFPLAERAKNNFGGNGKTIENGAAGEGSVQGALEESDKPSIFAEDFFSKSHLIPMKKEGVSDIAVPNAHASLILDADSGTILHYQSGRERRAVASLAKILTAVIVLEEISDLEEVVTIDGEAVYAEGTKIGCPRSGYCVSNRLRVGEQISVINLLKAMLMNSANDAAIALAKHLSGSQEEFAKLMNEKASGLDLADSRFCTPSGLEIDGKENECYSSAYDIARIAAYSLKYDIIWDIMRLPNNTVIASIDGEYSHELINTDLALDQIPNCLGGKTGFTPLAGHSLLMAAEDPSGKHRIVAVVLNNPYRWQDVKKMIDWAFAAYDWR
jgi:serine-type D-Ala-D-Ala carboxypeptidase (penicillin-binding protein 5/6)